MYDLLLVEKPGIKPRGPEQNPENTDINPDVPR